MLVSPGNQPAYERNYQMKTGLLLLACASLNLAQSPVEVKNTIQDVIPVRDLSAQQAVVHRTEVNFNGQGTGTVTPYHVPPRKRLVIDYITYNVRVPTGRYCTVLLWSTFQNTDRSLRFATSHRLPSGNTDLTSGNQLMKMYADPETWVGAQVYSDTTQGLSAVGEITLYGYLVDMPIVLSQAR